jgi:hypothetical protein
MLNTIFNSILVFLNWIISFFPNADSNVVSFITSNLATLKTWLSAVNFFFDIPSLILIITYAFTIELSILTIHIVQWILKNVSLGFYKGTK